MKFEAKVYTNIEMSEQLMVHNRMVFLTGGFSLENIIDPNFGHRNGGFWSIYNCKLLLHFIFIRIESYITFYDLLNYLDFMIFPKVVRNVAAQQLYSRGKWCHLVNLDFN